MPPHLHAAAPIRNTTAIRHKSKLLTSDVAAWRMLRIPENGASAPPFMREGGRPVTTTIRDVAPLLYTPEEAATALRIGRSTVYELMADGTLKFVKRGRSRRIRVTDLETYAASLATAN